MGRCAFHEGNCVGQWFKIMTVDEYIRGVKLNSKYLCKSYTVLFPEVSEQV